MPRYHKHFETFAQKQRREFREEIALFVADAALQRQRLQSARILTAR
ncbi:hypothetical protein ACQU0X_31030 [Pseudovibrio ascidiaceicola]